MVESKNIPTSKIEPNPWNPNKQSTFMFEHEVASIKEFGFVDPVTVRHHPKKRGYFEIIDGEHRWLAAKHIGLTEISCTNLGVIIDSRAKALTDILNNIKGEPDTALRAQMIRQIKEEDESLLALLPYSDDEMHAILEHADFDWSELDTKGSREPKEPKEIVDGESGWVGLKVSLSPEQHTLVATAMKRAKRLLKTKSDAEALAAICKAYG